PGRRGNSSAFVHIEARAEARFGTIGDAVATDSASGHDGQSFVKFGTPAPHGYSGTSDDTFQWRADGSPRNGHGPNRRFARAWGLLLGSQEQRPRERGRSPQPSRQ